MAISKVERLMNLVIALLSTRQFLTAERIRDSVAGYEDSVSDEAFSRMFERDKNELRDLGIPLEVGPVSRFSSVEGYRINRDAYELPDIDLTSAEAAAVAVAVQMWESPELAAAAEGALLKLRAAGIHVETEAGLASVPAVPARTRGSEPVLGKLLAAIDAGQAVRFEHRGAINAPYLMRDVEPWGVVTHHGRWYLVGHDRERNATRTFRLSRIGDEITAYGPRNAVRKPDDVDLREIVTRVTGSIPVSGSATVWVAEGRGRELRRLGVEGGTRTIGGRTGTVIEVPVRSRDWIARLITGLGPDAVVLAPADLREDVVARLRSVFDHTEVRA
ncbi:YafY family transcriptional regulator [Nocardia cyriacigeorgica]|uniref:helix-turn-helix transcriptional regulator n=1 Tax=Nocardia cyriacigeorgica TaxID=135487 RepID=UPI0003003462|nr:YafY family protein [Nocardia cyriacigeorgica]AVH23330.1 YafY family transcriptional regulator [Nocardia cyriacigeorgica]MBF6088147.1 YafY family transcriptional regulator [Nocardia cyriacigeorgica]MBF6095257.1 YafY family transcriptional regulator [Nocardia cyriacigeorgica]MBF6396430.1 YafY family transcriptional regulator [Nocardia cyriacigeorgica]MBF6402062.1 YafY family transcriptional regulator [Nocardia cyriacigeorgica]